MFNFSVLLERGLQYEFHRKKSALTKRNNVIFQPVSIHVRSPLNILCMAICRVNFFSGKYSFSIGLHLRENSVL